MIRSFAPLSGYLKDYPFGVLSVVIGSHQALSRDDVSALRSVCLSGYEHVAPSAGCLKQPLFHKDFVESRLYISESAKANPVAVFLAN
ncbi:hypothetical protein DFR28_10129 [Arenicella xantha]|uniref:Uncharacterized protein n=1 Tax=Arenicella xantha TaxID=644221 RepID=A0A395JM73_9GAMM|nr:hypothetical protein DFR28_10129 [Arenicella xantha]